MSRKSDPRQTPNFTKDTLRLRLSNPFYYRGSKDAAEKLVSEVTIARMSAIELDRIRNTFQSLAGNRNSYIIALKEFLENSITEFWDSDGNEIDSATIPALVMKTPFASAEKIFRFSCMLTRASSLFTTAYKCPECDATNTFDLDPSQPIPDDVEDDRQMMQDYMDFYSEVINTTGDRSFTVSLQFPIELKVPPIEDKPASTLSMSEVTIEYPTVSTYMKIAKDAKKMKDVDTWIVFESIVSINGLSAGETESILKDRDNGHKRVMRFHKDDWSNIRRELDRYGIEIKHSYQCMSCGAEVDTRFDDTNFFDFLKS